VMAVDGVTTKSYTVAVIRALPLLVGTEAAEVPTSAKALLKGTVTPHGAASVFFEYGTTTAYGATTPSEGVSGDLALEFQAMLNGLPYNVVYHCRAVAENTEGRVYGSDVSFTTKPEAPLAATGDPTAVTSAGATLVGAVNPKGVATQVYFEYGLTELYGNTTPTQTLAGGVGVVDVLAPINGLLPNAHYHYRIVASNAAGDAVGMDVVFLVTPGSGVGSAAPTATPAVTTGGVAGVSTAGASLLGSVNPNAGTTFVHFEYGTTTGYGLSSPVQGVGNGTTPAAVSLAADGLPAGTLCHYRLVASNSLGATAGADAVFITLFLPPTVSTGDTLVLTTTSAQVAGTVQAHNTPALVYFDYGTDGITFPNSVGALPPSVNGDASISVSAALPNLAQGVTYYYRARAVGTGGTGLGGTKSLKVAMLSGLIQRFPDGEAAAQRQGAVMVTLTPAGIGGGWRLAGEQTWRQSAVSATGLTSGDRVLEYRPVAGYLQPANETVSVIDGAAPILLGRAYTPSGATGSGTLVVTLKPDALADSGIAVANRAQWRLFGESAAQWKDSGTSVSGLVPGNQLIECKDVAGRSTPPAVTATIVNGQTTASTLTYFLKQAEIGTPPGTMTFDTVSAAANLPYAYCGQIRSDAGSSSGFVVRPRVVVTAGHVVFDDGTLTTAGGLEWLFQRDRDVNEPKPQVPRGFYLLSGYAAQRALDNSPGSSSPQSQTLDAATLFFLEDASRSGFSGYLASDATSNEFLLSPALKTLVGYPVDGIPAADRDRMHATSPANVVFAPAYGRTYTTSDIRSVGGNSGGPLCIQYENGNYYPAAIYLGGTAQTVVRALDSDVVEIIGLAEASGALASTSSGGNLSVGGTAPIATPSLGALQVAIEPTEARAAGAGWRLRSQAPYQAGGFRLSDLSPDTYTVDFATVDGFLSPARQSVTVSGGQLATLTFTYEKIPVAPVITSTAGVSCVRGQALAYQITALNAPATYSLRGILPAGMSFDAVRGLISGTPLEAGSFVVTVGAANAGGADTRTVAIIALPVMAAQVLTAPSGQPLTYQIASSESGAGLTFTAAALPPGLTLDTSSGRMTGTPTVSGTFPIPVSVTIRSATASTVLTLNITGTSPVFTQQPVSARTISYGGSTTLSATADGLPVPTFQWYRGVSGNIASPIAGATSNSFTTPDLTTNTSYWVRASSISGRADSNTSVIAVLPSTNANLSNLALSAGTLAPTFNAGILSYTASVYNSVSSITVTPSAEVNQSSVKINGSSVALDAPSAPLALVVGPNLITAVVTAGDGITLNTYVVTVTRAGPSSIATGQVVDITATSATLCATVTPNGSAVAFFQYGTTTAYGNSTPPQDVAGTSPVTVQALVKGLEGNTIYHFRSGVTSAAGTVYGTDGVFTTAPKGPLAATGNAINVTASAATLLGAVNTNGLATEVYFEYGPTTAYGVTTSPHDSIPASVGIVDISHAVTGVDASYHFRLVAMNVAGTAYGVDMTVGSGTSGDKSIFSKPAATSGGVTDVTTTSAVLQGVVNPHNKTTLVSFQYGLTSAYGSTTTGRGVGNGNDPANVTQAAEALQPGTLYHYRVVASNSIGDTIGGDATFTTLPLDPIVTTGGAAGLTTTSVRVNGTVRARSATTSVFFEYGTDGVTFPNSVAAVPASVGGEIETPVSVELDNLNELRTYFYRVRAVSLGGSDSGDTLQFKPGTLAGLTQRFSQDIPAADHTGQVVINLTPVGIGAWRFVGEPTWRASGVAATGLTTADRLIEFRPVAGYIQPNSELLGVVSGEPLALERFYYKAAAAGSGGLRILLEPAAVAAPGLPAASRTSWRLMGDADTAWKDSGVQIGGLMPGSYLIECKSVAGWNTPTAATVVVDPAAVSTLTITYFPASAPFLIPPAVVSFQTASSSRNLPYAYVGQILNNGGAYSGFVVKPRVVATVAQAVFDEATLSASTGMEWLLQRDKGTYEPDPQVPRGFYLFDGYSTQRAVEATPGTFSLASQNLNVAAMYFAQDAGRSGFSGFLASDADPNEFLQSSALKTLIGYPVSGIVPDNQGRMHATEPSAATFVQALGRTYTSAANLSLGGMIGGPLCVQRDGGSYFPAGICVGGTTAGAVRAIDGSVLDLFSRAEISGTGGDNNTGGGITHTSFTSFGIATQPGAIKVTIQPEAARIAGGAWLLAPETTQRASGDQKVGLSAGTYVLQFTPIAGYQDPAPQTVLVTGGVL